MIIENGVGDGTKAKVDSRNSLLTTAITTTDEEWTSLNQSEAYELDTGVITVPASFNGPVILMRNLDGSRDIVVSVIAESLDAPSTGANISVLRNPTIGTLANNTAKAPLNLNFESGQAANVEAWIWDGAGTAGITGVTALANGTFGPFVVSVNQVSQAPVVLGSNSVIAVNIASGAAGYDATASLRFHFDTSGAK